jgi:WD40 repeat protein
LVGALLLVVGLVVAVVLALTLGPRKYGGEGPSVSSARPTEKQGGGGPPAGPSVPPPGPTEKVPTTGPSKEAPTPTSIRLAPGYGVRSARYLDGGKAFVSLLERKGNGPRGREWVVKVWDLAANKEALDIGLDWAALDAAPSPDGALIAVSRYADRSVVLFDRRTGKESRRLARPDDKIWATAPVRFSPKGDVALTSSASLVVGWQFGAGDRAFVLEEGDEIVTDFRFFPDGKHVAVGGNKGTIRIWDVVEKRAIRTIRTANGLGALKLAVSNDGMKLAAYHHSITVWDVGSGDVLHVLPEKYGFVGDLLFLPEGETLVYPNDRDHTITLFDLKRMAPRRRFKGHTDDVWCLALSPDGRTLLSASSDETVRLWAVPQGP